MTEQREVERLRRQVAELRAALVPFACAAREWNPAARAAMDALQEDYGLLLSSADFVRAAKVVDANK